MTNNVTFDLEIDGAGSEPHPAKYASPLPHCLKLLNKMSLLSRPPSPHPIMRVHHQRILASPLIGLKDQVIRSRVSPRVTGLG